MVWLPGSVLTVPALFAAGAVASVHCSAMCGAVSAHHARAGGSKRLAQSLISVQSGRVLGYALLGALAGALGQSLLRYLPGLRVGLALQAVAALLLALAGLRLLMTAAVTPPCCAAPIPRAALAAPRPASKPMPAPMSGLASARSDRTTNGFGGGFGGGLLWALMPCGLLYSVLLLSALSGNGLDGALLAGAFALGGSPALAAIGWHSARRRHGATSRRRTGWCLLAIGLASFSAITILPAVAGSAWCAPGEPATTSSPVTPAHTP